MATPGLKEKLDTAAQTTALARPVATVLGIFQDEAVKKQLALALPSGGLTAERLLRVALTELRRNPKLAECSRDSFLGALMTAAHLGLEIGGPLGHFYPVPFWNSKRRISEVVGILGYRGMIVLARRSREVEDVVAREVCENDQFEFSYGIEDRLVHVPAEGDRGAAVKFYGIARYTNGGHLVRVMSRSEVDAYRKRSRAKDDGPWVSDYVAMACKTVIRRMAAFMPLTTEAATAIAEDEERELGYGPGELVDVGGLSVQEGEQGPGSDASAAANPASPSESAPSQGESGELPSGAGGAEAVGASAGNPTAEATTPVPPAAEVNTSVGAQALSPADAGPYVCPICGAQEDASGHTKHDDAKHGAEAKSKREAKKAEKPDESLPLEGGS